MEHSDIWAIANGVSLDQSVIIVLNRKMSLWGSHDVNYNSRPHGLTSCVVCATKARQICHKKLFMAQRKNEPPLLTTCDLLCSMLLASLEVFVPWVLLRKDKQMYICVYIYIVHLHMCMYFAMLACPGVFAVLKWNIPRLSASCERRRRHEAKYAASHTQQGFLNPNTCTLNVKLLQRLCLPHFASDL